jgi:hypothetical protein
MRWKTIAGSVFFLVLLVSSASTGAGGPEEFVRAVFDQLSRCPQPGLDVWKTHVDPLALKSIEELSDNAKWIIDPVWEYEIESVNESEAWVIIVDPTRLPPNPLLVRLHLARKNGRWHLIPRLAWNDAAREGKGAHEVHLFERVHLGPCHRLVFRWKKKRHVAKGLADTRMELMFFEATQGAEMPAEDLRDDIRKILEGAKHADTKPWDDKGYGPVDPPWSEYLLKQEIRALRALDRWLGNLPKKANIRFIVEPVCNKKKMSKWTDAEVFAERRFREIVKKENLNVRELTSLTNPASHEKHRQILERIRCEYRTK